MYPVSEAFLQAVQENTRKYYWTGTRILGYDTNEAGKLVVNRKQAKIVQRLYMEFLHGKTTDYIKLIFEREGVVNWNGSTKWQATTLASMLMLARFRVLDFMELTEHAQPIQELDVNLMLRTLDHIKVYESGVVVTAR